MNHADIRRRLQAFTAPARAAATVTAPAPDNGYTSATSTSTDRLGFSLELDASKAIEGMLNVPAVRAEVPSVEVKDGVAVMRLYDPIDGWGEMFGVSAKEFATALDALPEGVNEIRLHINSPGGDVFDGVAILNALRAHPAKVVAVVDGLAASAASVVACGADELVMARNSELMIHDAWGLCVGNAEDMTTMADMLDHLSDNIASVYAEKAGTDVAVWRAAMEKETWYSADEAVEAGLADRVDAKKAAGKNRFDLSIFNYAGRDNAPDPDDQPVATVDPVDTPEAASDNDATGAESQDAEDIELRARALQLIAATR